MPAQSVWPVSNSSSSRTKNFNRRVSATPSVKFLVAIDFALSRLTPVLIKSMSTGTTLSYVAYMNIADPSNENIVSKWDNVQEKHVPTVLKYDNGGTSGLFKWGHGALKSLKPGERLHEWFKLGLHREVQENLAAESDFIHMFPSSTALPPVKGDDCERLVIHYLKSLNTAIHKYLTENLFLGENVPIQKEYIMTIPAMWSDSAKQTTARCAQRALNLIGDDEQKLQVIAEPQAAGIYALTNMRNTGLREGHTCIICDAGGGLHGHVKRWGERETRWLKSAVNKWFEQDVKPHFSGKDDENAYYETYGLGDNIGIPNDILEISGKDIREKIFDPVIRRIQILVRDQITVTVNEGEKVTAVLLAGGFGNNAYLRTSLESICRDRSVVVHAIHESELAIVRGALIYGRAKAFMQRRAEAMASGSINEETEYKDELDPGIIMSDVPAMRSPAHVGVVRYEKYDPNKHLGDYDLSTLKRDSSGAPRVEVMEWFVHKGDELREDEPKTYPLRWEREAKNGDGERLEIISKVFSYEGKTPPKYPDSPVHPNPATLKIVFKNGLPKHPRNNRFWYDERFVVNMVQGSAKTIFFLVHDGKKHDIQEVMFSK
ncbi:Hsp70 family chaperone, putative [Metarhizium acridum CQMa 102]|uniref:Hsp70 family chaperone, putative n=1 Tax=Metarhizium acridum (strain CQMa 102) TaxID=655827 RepID=E9DQY6_METAQ|nr:Hsp70 family chaperone, putative [Metarhizium acridum CQMa 102]EFY93664.1 Hsp70 family chaperone, putative [Metarhizium acridum CQMa 102]